MEERLKRMDEDGLTELKILESWRRHVSGQCITIQSLLLRLPSLYAIP